MLSVLYTLVKCLFYILNRLHTSRRKYGIHFFLFIALTLLFTSICHLPVLNFVGNDMVGVLIVITIILIILQSKFIVFCIRFLIPLISSRFLANRNNEYINNDFLPSNKRVNSNSLKLINILYTM